MGKDTKEENKLNAAANKEKSKHHNKLMQDIEKAKQLSEEHVVEKVPPSKTAASNPLIGLPDPKKGKLAPLDNKQDANKKKDLLDDFDFLDLDTKKEEPKKTTSNKKKDDDDFDFEFEDINPDEGSKMPPGGNKIVTAEEVKVGKASQPVGGSAPKVADKDKKKDLEIEIPPQDVSDSKEDKAEEDEYIIIDGKRFREIQIEGEEDEFLMDDDGNIYDKEGVYIGTAKDGGEEEEEETDNDK